MKAKMYCTWVWTGEYACLLRVGVYERFEVSCESAVRLPVLDSRCIQYQMPRYLVMEFSFWNLNLCFVGAYQNFTYYLFSWTHHLRTYFYVST